MKLEKLSYLPTTYKQIELLRDYIGIFDKCYIK